MLKDISLSWHITGMKTRSIIFKFIVEIKIIYPILFLKSIVLVSRNTVKSYYGYNSVAKTMSLFDNLRNYTTSLC